MKQVARHLKVNLLLYSLGGPQAPNMCNCCCCVSRHRCYFITSYFWSVGRSRRLRRCLVATTLGGVALRDVKEAVSKKTGRWHLTGWWVEVTQQAEEEVFKTDDYRRPNPSLWVSGLYRRGTYQSCLFEFSWRLFFGHKQPDGQINSPPPSLHPQAFITLEHRTGFIIPGCSF